MKRLAKTLISLTVSAAIALSIGVPVSAGWTRNNAGAWTYYHSSNQKASGWLKLGSVWYYLDSKGIMVTGWRQIGGIWYYFNSNGSMKTGWLKSSKKWYYLNNNGSLKTGWLKLGSTWYYLNKDGSMKTGWLLEEGNWYYLNNNGSMKTGWLDLEGQRYYLLLDGKMVTGYQAIEGISYSFESNGVLIPNTTILDTTKYEQEVLKLVNQIRIDAGLFPLNYSTTLSLGAKIRAEEIALKFDHIRPNGTNWYTVFPEIGQSADGTGENIARNYSTPEAVVQSWMDSADHRKNILDPDFCHLGIRYLKKISGEEYWVQLFSNTLY